MTSLPVDEFNFCSASGEMADRLRAFDWSSTALGPPAVWPDSLRLMLGICLDSHFPMAVWWGPELIQFYNDGYRPILGTRKHPQGFGQPARTSWPEIWPTIGPMVEQVMAQGQAIQGDDMALVLDRNGYPEACHFTFSYSPIRDGSGAVAGMLTVAVETTQRVLAERRQAFQLTLADNLRELSMADHIIASATRLLGEHLQASQAFYAETDDASSTFFIPSSWSATPGLPDLPASGSIGNYSPALLQSITAGRPFVVHDTQADPRVAAHRASYDALGIRAMVVVPLVKSRQLRATFNVTDNAARHWSATDILVIADVAERIWDAVERARAEQALRIENDNRKRAEAALRSTDRRKDEFLAMLAHELRNPLAPIRAAADLLLMSSLDEARIRKTCAIISRQVTHMTGLIEDLMDVSRVTRGLATLEKVELDARRLLSDAVEQARPLLERHGHQFSVHEPPDPALVLGDPKRLVQVMSNLLNNAAKYTPPGGVITLRVQAHSDQVVLDVSDNGIGMEPELIARAFDLFAQAQRTTDRSQGGLGIGLALVRNLVEMHGGKVTAHSAGPGQGSCFSVSLPRVHRGAPAPLAGLLQPATGEAAVPLRILVVDDNVDAATMLAMLVGLGGHEVVVEHESRLALQNASVLLPEVCLLDIGLPGMDGNELARHLRAVPGLESAIFIAITGYGQAQDRENSLAAGFDHHFMKPVDTLKLTALLKQISEDKTAGSAT